MDVEVLTGGFDGLETFGLVFGSHFINILGYVYDFILFD